MTFLAQNGAVHMTGHHAPVRLSEASVDQLLDVFELEGAVEPFNELYEAARQAYGTDFIPRATCLRLVVDNDPQTIVRAMLAASIDTEERLYARADEPRCEVGLVGKGDQW